MSETRTYSLARPSTRAASAGQRDCIPNALPVRFEHARQWQIETRTGSPSTSTVSCPHEHSACRVAFSGRYPGVRSQVDDDLDRRDQVAWYRYSYQYADFPDYPKLGVWPDAYYVALNLFNGTTDAYKGPEVCAYDRAKMLAGPVLNACSWTSSWRQVSYSMRAFAGQTVVLWSTTGTTASAAIRRTSCSTM